MTSSPNIWTIAGAEPPNWAEIRQKLPEDRTLLSTTSRSWTTNLIDSPKAGLTTEASTRLWSPKVLNPLPIWIEVTHLPERKIKTSEGDLLETWVLLSPRSGRTVRESPHLMWGCREEGERLGGMSLLRRVEGRNSCRCRRRSHIFQVILMVLRGLQMLRWGRGRSLHFHSSLLLEGWLMKKNHHLIW